MDVWIALFANVYNDPNLARLWTGYADMPCATLPHRGLATSLSWHHDWVDCDWVWYWIYRVRFGAPQMVCQKKKVLTSVQRGVGVGRDTLCKEPDDAMEVTTGTIVRWSPRPPHGRVVCAW
jgi:hypothetical protein